jgi:uncharacterized ferritin-like protein (DUF455 family)
VRHHLAVSETDPFVSETVGQYAQSVLLQGSLQAKLRPPPEALRDEQADDALHQRHGIEPQGIERHGIERHGIERSAPWHQPVRDAAIAMSDHTETLPKPGSLAASAARIACLSRFAHHELQAVELFAWALLAWPHAPSALRRGWLQALAEEQQHCQLYLERLHDHGASFGELPLSGYFWKSVPRIAEAPDPLLAFLCAQGLTLEQANLDFTILYRDAFLAGGDPETARVLQRVHDEEIGHVKLAAVWLKRLTGLDDLAAYQGHVPFPYSLARSKARRFERVARERAGLSPAFIDAVRAARPYPPRQPASASTP